MSPEVNLSVKDSPQKFDESQLLENKIQQLQAKRAQKLQSPTFAQNFDQQSVQNSVASENQISVKSEFVQ